ncbi:glucokinase regulatory protein-like isoform X2 [Cyprinus carpio]|uniref:Glucokinase regulatory protein-like isoform X2 n=1 Tax=Cyprinus carpio TaxID=7962 RepID=A0A9R0AIB8_CYPCA|nr:glucokinase regulatory protein-like isoform X2 [Cyprinus carpio]
MNMDHMKSCHKLSLPIMEKCNPISRDIDRVNGKQMVQILRRCDAEIFEKKINHDPFDQTSFNEMLNAPKQKAIYSYITAGGDRVLLTSQEAPEDDPALRARTLHKKNM